MRHQKTNLLTIQLFFMRRAYSQNDEEKVILEYFGDYKGSLLSFGENDGETLSNCRALMLSGWFGIFVEPSPSAFEKLKALYKDYDHCVFANVAASDYSGYTTLYDSGPHLTKNDSALLSTINPAERARWRKEAFHEVRVRVVDAKEFNNFNANFISIDAEGEDIKILRRLDLSYCRLLCIEWNSIPDNKKQIDDIMLSRGFKLIHQNAENLIYSIN